MCKNSSDVFSKGLRVSCLWVLLYCSLGGILQSQDLDETEGLSQLRMEIAV